MARLYFILILYLFQPLVFGQKKYKFKYREYLKGQQSIFTSDLTDTLIDGDKSNLTFIVTNRNGAFVPFAKVKIQSNTIDTLLHSNIDGFVTVILPPDNYSVLISSFPFTSLKLDTLEVKENTKTTIKASLGKSNYLRIALIYSKRRLKDSEIEKIIDDLSNERKDNELIKDKTCFILWEI